MLKPSLIAKTDAKANENQIYTGNGCRITVLTSRLIRVEYSPENKFTDLASYAVWFRKFDGVDFTVKEQGAMLVVETAEVKFFIKKKSGKPAFVEFKESGKTVKANNKNKRRENMLVVHLCECTICVACF